RVVERDGRAPRQQRTSDTGMTVELVGHDAAGAGHVTIRRGRRAGEQGVRHAGERRHHDDGPRSPVPAHDGHHARERRGIGDRRAAELENRDLTHGGDLVARKTRPAAPSTTALASRISASVTAVTTPFVSRIARTARSYDAGLPMLIALATVRGSTRWRRANCSRKLAAKGAAPAACTAASRGVSVISPQSRASASALPKAAVLPRLPAGSTIQSGAAQSSCCNSSSTIVFC